MALFIHVYMSVPLNDRNFKREHSLQSKYPLPSWISLRCFSNEEIMLYRRTNAGFYRNQLFDFELVGILKSEDELKSISEKF